MKWLAFVAWIATATTAAAEVCTDHLMRDDLSAFRACQARQGDASAPAAPPVASPPPALAPPAPPPRPGTGKRDDDRPACAPLQLSQARIAVAWQDRYARKVAVLQDGIADLRRLRKETDDRREQEVGTVAELRIFAASVTRTTAELLDRLLVLMPAGGLAGSIVRNQELVARILDALQKGTRVAQDVADARDEAIDQIVIRSLFDISSLYYRRVTSAIEAVHGLGRNVREIQDVVATLKSTKQEYAAQLARIDREMSALQRRLAEAEQQRRRTALGEITAVLKTARAGCGGEPPRPRLP